MSVLNLLDQESKSHSTWGHKSCTCQSVPTSTGCHPHQASSSDLLLLSTSSSPLLLLSPLEPWEASAEGSCKRDVPQKQSDQNNELTHSTGSRGSSPKGAPKIPAGFL
ncbi:hypothetical protein GN956_G21439 [Arapaima gigas]